MDAVDVLGFCGVINTGSVVGVANSYNTVIGFFDNHCLNVYKLLPVISDDSLICNIGISLLTITHIPII